MTQNVLHISDPKSSFSETKYGTVKYNSESRKTKIKNFFKQNLLAIATLLAVIFAVIIGIIVKNHSGKWSERSLMYLEFPGDIFLRMLKCLILPLIISSLISALGNLDSKLSGQIGKRAVLYYFLTTISAIILGIILVLVVRPGDKNSAAQSTNAPKRRAVTTEDTILDLIRYYYQSVNYKIDIINKLTYFSIEICFRPI